MILLYLYLLFANVETQDTSGLLVNTSIQQINEIRSSMQSRQFQQVIQRIDDLDNPQDLHHYLQALAYFYDQQYRKSVEACDRLIAQGSDSPWQHKAIFLQAKAYAQLKDFKQAEQIYRSQVDRLLSAKRKNNTAQVYIDFAQKVVTPLDLIEQSEPMPEDYRQAYSFYQQALELEIETDLKAEVMFQMGKMMQLATDYATAERDYQRFLQAFPLVSGQDENRDRIFESIVNLAICQIHLGNRLAARQNLKDLISPSPKQLPEGRADLLQRAKFLLVRTYLLSNRLGKRSTPSNIPEQNLASAIDAANQFIQDYPKQLRSGQLAFEIGRAYQSARQTANAIAAYRRFLEDFSRRFKEERSSENPALGLLPLTGQPIRIDDLAMKATFQLGQLYFDQQNYASAIDSWNRYLVDFPNGPQWTEIQRRIIDAEFQTGIHLIISAKMSHATLQNPLQGYERGLQVLDQFQTRFPLDKRISKILTLKGQIYSNHKKFLMAIAIWEKLVSKYPRTEAASYALFQIGQIYQNELGHLQKAIDTYRQLTWGAWQPRAQDQLRQMIEKQLILTTERVFRSSETVEVRLQTRNIEQVQVDIYNLNPEAYWRKMGTLKGVEDLDLALIQPNQSLSHQIDDYQKFALINQRIQIPFDQPGACAVHVSDGELESTTLVIRSDLELIAKTSRFETLVFVQDQRQQQPVPNAQVLVRQIHQTGQNTTRVSQSTDLMESANQNQIGLPDRPVQRGTTGTDGVYRLDNSRNSKQQSSTDNALIANEVSVLVIKDGHIASNETQIGNLSWPKGLKPKGYIYTDRPAYQPGQTVFIRGIIRDVNLKYVVRPQAKYQVTIIEAQGREIYTETVELSPFGTFSLSMPLDESATVGEYRILVIAEMNTESESANESKSGGSSDYGLPFNGQFLVKHFQLPPIQIAFDFDRQVYFRGETIKATIKVNYTYGQPLSKAKIRYSLPNGQTVTQTADSTGQLQITFDTRLLTEELLHQPNSSPLQTLQFTASVEGENVGTTATMSLAPVGFWIHLRPRAKVVLAGETVEIEASTTQPDGQPIGRELRLDLFRITRSVDDDLLTQLSWLGLGQPVKKAETPVRTITGTTDPKTGKITFRFQLEKGGDYRLRALGRDRFNQPVVTTTNFTISDQSDQVKLRIFAETTQLKLGQSETISIHSRLEHRNDNLSLALITFEGNRIIDYQVMALKHGENPITIQARHEHYPNFFLTISAIDESSLRQAERTFTVQQDLHLQITPSASNSGSVDSKFVTYLPEQETKLEILATDQLGRPVEAELSLSLTESLLWQMFPDPLLPINDFFYQGSYRQQAMRTVSSCDFSYRPATRRISLAIREESNRLKVEEKELEQRQRGRQELKLGLLEDAFYSSAEEDESIVQQELAPARKLRAEARKPAAASSGRRAKQNAQFGRQLDTDAVANQERAQDTIQFLLEQVVWMPAIQTDQEGQATVNLHLPNKNTQWDLRAHGCTAETLVGQAKASLVTKQDFFLQAKLPSIVVEGDQLQVEISVHNSTDFVGPATIHLKTNQAKMQEVDSPLDLNFTQPVTLTAHTVSHFILPPIEVVSPSDQSGGQLRLEITVEAGQRSYRIQRQIPIRPWGVPYADNKSGWSATNRTVFLQLPADRTYTNPKLSVRIGKDINRLVYDLVDGNRPVSLQSQRLSIVLPSRKSELLSVASALYYLRQVGGAPTDNAQLTSRLRQLIGRLVSTQNSDGGWHWVIWRNRWRTQNTRAQRSDPILSARHFWALIEAEKTGVAFNRDLIDKANHYLRNALQNAAASSTRQSDENTAILLQALSEGHTNRSRVGIGRQTVSTDPTNFSIANRLYRNRNRLSLKAKAYTALALANMDRVKMAIQVLQLLPTVSDKVGLDLETIAIASLAWQTVGETTHQPIIDNLIQSLLSQRGTHVFWAHQDLVVATLALYFGQTQFAADDYQLQILVNGQEIQTDLTAETSSTEVNVPTSLFVSGMGRRELSCRIEFQLQGQGTYTYFARLSGFSDQLPEPKTQKDQKEASEQKKTRPIQKNLFYPQLTYQGRPIGVDSTATLTQLTIGQRAEVRLSLSLPTSTEYVVNVFFPAGASVIEGSLKGDFLQTEVLSGQIRFYLNPKLKSKNRSTAFKIRYQLAGYLPGVYRTLPTMLQSIDHNAHEPTSNLVNPSISLPSRLVIASVENETPPMETDATDHPTRDLKLLNVRERFVLGQRYFADQKYRHARSLLSQLRRDHPNHQTAQVARMLMWIYTDSTEAKEQFQELVSGTSGDSNDYVSQQLVEVFEVLRERQPDLYVPLDRIQIVGQAYRNIQEFERAMLVHQATIDASFKRDVKVSGDIADHDLFADSIRFATDLWLEYADTPVTASTYFGMAQTVADQANKAKPKETPTALRLQAIHRLETFRTLYPNHPLADDAALSQVNLLLDLEDYDNAINLSQQGQQFFTDSEFLSSFQYTQSLAHFAQMNFDQAIQYAEIIAEGGSEDKNLAQYILGQIYHAQNKPGQAIQWYTQVKSTYPDAEESIDYFEQQKLEIPEVTIIQPNAPKTLDLTLRNIDRVQLQIYQVDLMKLFLRQKNLSQMSRIRLAGVEPQLTTEIKLNNPTPYLEHRQQVQLDLSQIGAYLIICRGDQASSSTSEFTSGLMLITPLEMEVQPVGDRLRLNLKSAETGDYQPKVHLKAIGSANQKFIVGQTDMRGLFVVDGLTGRPTVIAKSNARHPSDTTDSAAYAFYRGQDWIGPKPSDLPSVRNAETDRAMTDKKGQAPEKQTMRFDQSADYRQNLNRRQQAIQQSNIERFENLRRSENKGIQMQYAY